MDRASRRNAALWYGADVFRLAAIFVVAISLSGCGGGLFGGSDCVSGEEYVQAERKARAESERRYDEALTRAGLERVELPAPEYDQEDAYQLGDWAVRATEDGGQELVASSPGRLARDAKGRYYVIEWSAEPLRERTLTLCGCDPGQGIEQRNPGPPVYRVALAEAAQFAGSMTVRTPIDRVASRWEHADGPPEMGCHMAP